MDDKTTLELEAAAFRRLVDHLRERTDVQNIDLMKGKIDADKVLALLPLGGYEIGGKALVGHRHGAPSLERSEWTPRRQS